MSWIKLTTILLITFELTGCSIARPKGLICVAHVANPPHVPVSYNHCYDMEKDFDNKGVRIPGHNGQDIPLVMDKHLNLDPDSAAELMAYWQKLVARYEKCGQ